VGPVPRRTTHLESAASIAVVFILLAVVGVILNRQAGFDMSRFGIVSEQEGDFLPVGKAETYNTDNLYEKINGKAPMYQEAGFLKLTTRRFAAKINTELGFELYQYDMGNTKNAFSVYSRQKRADATVLPDAPFIYSTTNAVYLSYGRYYAELVGFAESEQLIEMLRGFARKLAAALAIDVNDATIGELAFFPQQNLVPGSAKLHLKNAFGFDGLTDTFTGACKIDGQPVTVFFSKRQNQDEARRVAQSYCDFLIANGAKDKPAGSETLKQLKAGIFDLYGTIEIVFTTGPFMAGIHEADNATTAGKSAEMLLNRLNEIVNEKSNAAE
jgi:hypothetical protein